MKSKMICGILCCLLLTVGCGDEAPREKVKIIKISFDHQVGSQDYQTVVEFPDGSRRVRYGEWGYEGDEFMAKKYQNWGWISP